MSCQRLVLKNLSWGGTVFPALSWLAGTTALTPDDTQSGNHTHTHL